MVDERFYLEILLEIKIPWNAESFRFYLLKQTRRHEMRRIKRERVSEIFISADKDAILIF
jgi:nicotinamide riboside kinase